MTIEEIYTINRALDGADIVFLPPLADLGLSELTIDAVKEGLIVKGLLENHGEFTGAGLRAADRLRRYKQAKKHVMIGNLMLGIENENESVMILWNPVFREYAVSMLDSGMAAGQIADSHGFLAGETAETAEAGEEELDYRGFTARIAPGPGDSFRLRTRSDGGMTDEVYGRSDGRLYIYDCLSGILRTTDRAGVMAALEERMEAP